MQTRICGTTPIQTRLTVLSVGWREFGTLSKSFLWQGVKFNCKAVVTYNYSWTIKNFPCVCRLLIIFKHLYLRAWVKLAFNPVEDKSKFQRSGVSLRDSSSKRISKLWCLSLIVGEAKKWWFEVKVFNLEANIKANIEIYRNPFYCHYKKFNSLSLLFVCEIIVNQFPIIRFPLLSFSCDCVFLSNCICIFVCWQAKLLSNANG